MLLFYLVLYPTNRRRFASGWKILVVRKIYFFAVVDISSVLEYFKKPSASKSSSNSDQWIQRPSPRNSKFFICSKVPFLRLGYQLTGVPITHWSFNSTKILSFSNQTFFYSEHVSVIYCLKYSFHLFSIISLFSSMMPSAILRSLFFIPLFSTKVSGSRINFASPSAFSICIWMGKCSRLKKKNFIPKNLNTPA